MAPSYCRCYCHASTASVKRRHVFKRSETRNAQRFAIQCVRTMAAKQLAATAESHEACHAVRAVSAFKRAHDSKQRQHEYTVPTRLLAILANPAAPAFHRDRQPP